MHPVIRALLQTATENPYAMRIATSTTGTNYCYFEKASIVNSAKVTVVESMIKMETAGSTRGQAISVNNGVKSALLAFTTTSIVCNASGTSPYTHTMDTTSAYHTYKIVFNGTTNVEFYVDETLVHTATYANLFSLVSNGIWFGDGETAANRGGSTLWKTFKYNLDYGADPENFVEWDSSSKPNTQGWTLYGTDLATIITE